MARPGPVTAATTDSQQARQLYEDGLTLRQVAGLLGISTTQVWRLLQAAGVPMRGAHRGNLRLVTEAPAPAPAPRALPEGAAVAFTADRGWHLVQAPPAWMLDLLAELD